MDNVCTICNENEPYIFISYSHEDRDIVVQIIDVLEKNGYRVWYDKNIDPGKRYAEIIGQKIIGCTKFIPFITENYIKSSFCKKEIHLADVSEREIQLIGENGEEIHLRGVNEKEIIPIYLEEVGLDKNFCY